MQVIRPIEPKDFPALQQIAQESGHGFTSLPQDEATLSAKIDRADSSFKSPLNERGEEHYLFVLEDITTGEILGTTGINASVGLSSPLYHYRRAQSVQHSARLGISNAVEVLNICNDYTGASEICTLFLREGHRKGHAGKLLSRVRFLFMAQHPERFSDTIIAEMRGVSDEDGHSPFFHWLKTHYMGVEFPVIDHLVGTGETEFIPQLMPKYPVYFNLLPEEAQQVVGEVHEKTLPALKMLEKEGFKHCGYVDLFDAGPTIESPLDKINTVKHSCHGAVEVAETEQEQHYLVCNHGVDNFRALCTNRISHADDGSIVLAPEVAEALQVNCGEPVRFIPLQA